MDLLPGPPQFALAVCTRGEREKADAFRKKTNNVQFFKLNFIIKN